MDERKQKKIYAEGDLQTAVKAIADVERLEYWTFGGEEYVTIHYMNGSTAHVCVSADSLAALAFDVFRYIRYH